MTPETSPTFTVCICTRNRPAELRHAIASVLASHTPVYRLVISDDSTDDRTRVLLAAEFPHVIYTQGPRRGLGANRNNALSHMDGSHVLFIDDDVKLDPDFFGQMADILASSGGADRLIVTGTELNCGERVFPHRQSFLGFQTLDYAADDRIYSIVINSTVFPAAVFEKLRFDPSLVYGYEEIDFTARAVFRHGFEVRLAPRSANSHYPSMLNRDFYAPFTEASRIYVTFKKYYFLERRPAKALVFLAVASAHNFAFNVRRHGAGGIAAFGRTIATTWSYLRLCFRDVAVHV